MRRAQVAAVGLLMSLVACAGSGAATTTTSEGGPTTVSSTISLPTTTTSESVTTTLMASTTTKGQEIDVHFEGGEVDGPDRFTVTVGEVVSIWVLSDTDEEIHLHGYDLIFPVAGHVPVEITFVADVPGIFEVEMEESATPLFQLEVTA